MRYSLKQDRNQWKQFVRLQTSVFSDDDDDDDVDDDDDWLRDGVGQSEVTKQGDTWRNRYSERDGHKSWNWMTAHLHRSRRYLYRFRFNHYQIEANRASLVETIDQWAVQGRRRRR